MASTTFVDNDLSPSNRIVASWLNDVNFIAYWVLGNGVSIPVTKPEAMQRLGVPAPVHDRLILSGGNLTLEEVNGSLIMIQGQIWSFAGVTPLPPTSLAPSTLYYIYAYFNGSAVVLETSTTGHVTGDYGVQVKSGDQSRTLVGMARTTSGTLWADSATQRFVTSWRNRRRIPAYNSIMVGSPVGTSSAPWVEISSTARVEFICWAQDAITLYAGITGNHTTGGNSSIYGGIGVDSTTGAGLLEGFGYVTVTTAEANIDKRISVTASANLGEGYHYATMLGGVSAGAVSYEGTAGYTSLGMVMGG